MAFGSLGGLGGRSMSFPTRPAAPTSEGVEYLPDYATWGADWNARRKALETPPDPVGPRPAAPTADGGAGGWGVGVDPVQWAQANQHLYRAGTPIPEMGWSFNTGGDPNYHPTAPTASYGLNYTTSMGGNTGIAPYVPDFSALDAERVRMMPLFQNQTRQQQGYDSMRGWGQENAVMGADYTSPTFGQITGDPTGGQGASPLSGIGQGALNGVYNPGATSAGVYGSSRRSSWGL